MFRFPVLARHDQYRFPRVRGDVPQSNSPSSWASTFSPRARGCSSRLRTHRKIRSVFPACAGMFLAINGSISIASRFPRVRGDVPIFVRTAVEIRVFSPRARGCSTRRGLRLWVQRVFPACAGMFLFLSGWAWAYPRFPRVRGDVPVARSRIHSLSWFSPRARGCSELEKASDQRDQVFPACAGMFRAVCRGSRYGRCFPRVRGDVPHWPPPIVLLISFSPRARGCSFTVVKSEDWHVVFPACAGMFLCAAVLGKPHTGFPRVRGDVPYANSNRFSGSMFSPRARGCSHPRNPRTSRPCVFPACAGMFPVSVSASVSSGCFPRVRGDVPTANWSSVYVSGFSPRARGCSELKLAQAIEKHVFPACAGMFRVRRLLARSSRGFPRVRGDVPPHCSSDPLSRRFSPRARGCSGPRGFRHRD